MWTDPYLHRPEHFYVGPRRCGKSQIVQDLRTAGYWAYEHTVESGDEIHKIYSAQRKVYEADKSEKSMPRIFFNDIEWWRYKARFHYVQRHLQAEISFPEDELEDLVQTMDVDSLYRVAGDARERLLPEIAMGYADALGENMDSNSKSKTLRKVGAEFLTKHYRDILMPLIWAVPQPEKWYRYQNYLAIERRTFDSRLRSYTSYGSFPKGMTSVNFTDALIASGICEYNRKYWLRFAEPFAAGLKELKITFTHKAIKEGI
jgi:hypothetical protein